LNSTVPRTVLCVEDEDLQLRLRKSLFESRGFNVLLARSGREALEVLESMAVDGVVMDYWMAGMNGVALARAIKQSHPTTPIVVLSGFTSLPDETIGLVDRWFQKAQSEPEELLECVSDLIAARRNSAP